MIWIHKSEENPWEATPLFSGAAYSGANLRVTASVPLLNARVTSRLDLSAESTLSGNVLTHRVFDGATPVGKITDTFTENEWVRKFFLSIPLSFYFENLPNHPLYHITPNRLYQEGGELVIRERAEENAGLYFRGENCIVHTERNQLLITAKAESARWVFRYEK